MSIVKSVLHFSLILSLLTSTIGLYISIHFCQGELQNFALWSQAERCCETDAASCCNADDQCTLPIESAIEGKCCEDIEIIQKAELDYKVPTYTNQLENQTASAAVFFDKSEPGDIRNIPVQWLNYHPPNLPVPDFNKIFCTFLC